MPRQSGVQSRRDRKNRPLQNSLKFCASQLAIASLFALAIPNEPATASRNQFDVCVGELVRSDISPELASRACAEALVPKDLSLCVLKIQELTSTIANDALVACTRVRRPIEMAKCVVRINDDTRDSQILSVLDHCRRSLLPLRFSECVLGVTRETDLSPGRAMETCIAATDFPRDLSPTFAPPPAPNPTPPQTVPEFTPNITPAPQLELEIE